MRPERRSVPGLEEEVPALEALLADDPSPRDVMMVAEGLWLLGRPERALDLLDRLAAENPSLIAPRVLAAWCCEDVGRREEALRHREAVAAMDPANPFARETEAEAPAPEPVVAAAEEPVGEEEEKEKEDEGDVAATKAIDDELLAEPERPLTEEELRAIPPGPLYSVTLADIFARQGFHEKAVQILRDLDRQGLASEEARDRLRALEEQLGRSFP